MGDERYSTDEYAYSTLPNEFLKRVMEWLPRGRVLSLAEGEGRNAVYLAEHGLSVVAVDASPVGLAKAQRLATQHSVAIETIVTDLAEFDIVPNTWDAIVSIFCHVPSALRRVLHRKLVAGLRPGGVLVLEAYTPAQLAHGTGGPKEAEMTMTLRALREELHGLRFVYARELEREVIECLYHTGKGAVVQIVATRP